MDAEAASEETEDDCRPIDGVTIDSYSQDDRSEATTEHSDYPTRTTDSFLPVPRPLRQTVFSSKDNETVESASSIATSDANIYERTLRDRADRAYTGRLLQEVLSTWREETEEQQQHAEKADLRYDEKLARECLATMREAFDPADAIERKKRLRMYLVWMNHRRAIWAMREWVVRHRENWVRKESEDLQNLQAASSALSKWRSAALDLQQRKSSFRQFFHACKFGRRWMEIVSERRMLRSMAELEQRYHLHKKEKERKAQQRTLATWHAKAASAVAMDVTAVQHDEDKTAKRAKELAHQALTTMYLTTVQSLAGEAQADQRYHAGLAMRVLDHSSDWRVQTRLTVEQEDRADQFVSLRDQQRAQHALRLMGRTATRTQQMEDQADAHQAKTAKTSAHQFLRRWRAQVAARSGQAVVLDAPATPAAKLSALRQSQFQSLR
ncbi:uncharacterized protein AB675_11179 [Cyphellophora attinorum]|uniref:Sfi1 spindle body domain-containing protein n=1 Tax=Cyphellophora attinorum TaxID=1664694 RepID=A0A0N1H4V1_9EURO|nr:uncharacterized protein AB675_11179 [Phialophora attinorum]KPI35846.1 hypothetical protein AB675_11179 [Phialophora attinorum]